MSHPPSLPHILFVSSKARFEGGVERHVHDLAAGLRARGSTVSLCVLDPSTPDETYTAPFAHVHSIAHLAHASRAADVVHVHRAVPPAQLAQARRPLLVSVHDHDLTCARSHRYLPLSHEPCDRAPGAACFAHGCPLVRDRSSPLGLSLRDPFALARDLRSLSSMATLVACSSYLRRTLIAAGAPPSRVVTVHPVPPLHPAPTRPAPRNDRVAFAGQLIRGKGLDVLLRALARRPELSLVVAGDGNGRADAEALSRSLRLSHRVSFLGRVTPDETMRVYDDAQVVVVPSRWPEPFGMVGVEAMRRGRVVVGARHGGIPEWLAEPHAGVGFTPGDDRSLALALDEALDTAHHDARAAASLAIAHERFSFHRMLDQLGALLVHAANTASPGSPDVEAHGSLAP